MLHCSGVYDEENLEKEIIPVYFATYHARKGGAYDETANFSCRR